jgi:iron complex transport system ATP-binding protein
MSAGIIELKGISFSYTPRHLSVLDAVSMQIDPHTITAILGPNGAGKTTLLRIIMGLRQPASGEVLLAGRSLESHTRKDLSRWMGLVPQAEYVPFEYSVLEYVLMGRAPYLEVLELPGQADVDIAREALATVGIADLEFRPVPELSGGELQLVLIARALAQQPKILLLDEPSAHLDLSNRNATLGILERLRQAGSTVIFTTHDPMAASLIADNLVLMKKGRILHAGSFESTFTSKKLSQAYSTQVEVLKLDGTYLVRTPEGQIASSP